MDDGTIQIIEVKGDNKIDDTIVLAKAAAAREMASSCYGAERGESKSYLKNTNAEQARRFQRMDGDLYDEPPPYDDVPF